MVNSRIPGFYQRPVEERLALLDQGFHFTDDEWATLRSAAAPAQINVDQTVENAIGHYELPLGLGLNFRINDKDHMVPMAIKEPSVIASANSRCSTAPVPSTPRLRASLRRWKKSPAARRSCGSCPT